MQIFWNKFSFFIKNAQKKPRVRLFLLRIRVCDIISSLQLFTLRPLLYG